jgi:serine/threonine kinase PknH
MCDTARGSREGSQLGRYYLKRRIGCGGLGEVYEAEDTVEERIVALKVVPPAFSHDLVFCARLQRAARTAGRLQEPHIVPIHDSSEIDGQLFLDMRLIEGSDLSRLLEQSGALTPPQAVAIVRQAASALDAAHDVGLVHGDIKPENILITPDDFVYVVDFGIAAAAARDGLAQIVGSAAETWKYTAPERFTDPVVNHKVDVYALTCVLYECVTGSPPYQADGSGALASAHLMNPIPQPSQLRSGLSSAFDDVIARGMAKDPQERYATAGGLALAAHEALSTQDQDLVGEIINRSQEATQPDADSEPPSGRIESSTLPAPSAPPTPTPQAPVGAPYQGPDVSESLPNPEVAPPVDPTGPPPTFPRFGLGDSGWPDEIATPPLVPRPSRSAPRRRTARLLLSAAAVLAVVILSGVAIWFLHPARSRSAARSPISTTSAAPSPAAAETQARLYNLLPQGYPPGTCKPITLSTNALAETSCGKNSDPSGPPSATYAIFPDPTAVHDAFIRIVQTSNIIECPGRIQSPGAWHRNTDPDKTSGMLLCGTQQGNPVVAWTNDSELRVSIAQAEPQGPTIDQLYAWWTTHS